MHIEITCSWNNLGVNKR